MALAALRELCSASTLDDIESVKEIVAKHHTNSYLNRASETDFILCKRSTKLSFVFRNGACLQTTEKCSIGNEVAYNSRSQESNSFTIVNGLVDAGDYSDIGGLVISVFNSGESFLYTPLATVGLHEKDWTDSSYGYCCTTVCPNDAKPYLGIYFYDAGFGYLYDPLNHDSPLVVKADDLKMFRIEIGLDESNSKAMHPMKTGPI